LAFSLVFRNRGERACDDLPSRISATNNQEQTMSASKRKLIIGLVGMAVLLISMLVYAQINASHNYNLDPVQLLPQ
jgi:hypothetical protein